MSSPSDQIAEEDADAQPPMPPRKWLMVLRRAGVLLLLLLLGLVALGWLQRENIARNLIGEQIDALGLPVTYDVAEISPERQVLENIVIGNPARPDLTIERIELTLKYGFGIPEIGMLTISRPRLYGSYKAGKLSFGSLDRVLFDDSKPSTGLPALDIKLIDGRGLIESDYGPLGVKLDGAGRLDGGFTGIAAAVAPRLEISRCSTGRASLYGAFTLGNDDIDWEGPARLADLRCEDGGGEDGGGEDGGASLKKVDAQVKLSLAQDISSITAKADVKATSLAGYGNNAAKLGGKLNYALSDKRMTVNFDLTAGGVDAGQVAARQIMLDGSLRGPADFANADIRGTISGNGIVPKSNVDTLLAPYQSTAEGTLAGPLLKKLRGALSSELRNSAVIADFSIRQSDDGISVVVPTGNVSDASGNRLLSLSQVQYFAKTSAIPRVSGNFRVGGRNLPRLVGRMEGNGTGQAQFRLKMDEYAAEGSRLTIPEMLLTQDSAGAISFTGAVEASGALPSGFAKGLRLPVNGGWDRSGGFAMWRQCTDVSFDSLAFANLKLNSRRLTFCPPKKGPNGGAIVRSGGRSGSGVQIAAGIAALDLEGTLADTPIKLKTGPVGIAYPGIATAKALDFTLGPEGSASRFVVSDLVANFGKGIQGEFSDADVTLAAIPLDMQKIRGRWSYDRGVLDITDMALTLADRAKIARFHPLAADGATLSLENNKIRAAAALRHGSVENHHSGGEIVSNVAIYHDLASGTGNADLDVPGLLFGSQLKIDELTPLAEGVIANVAGSVTGKGRIDWSADSIVSSGHLSSESLDFAAAFGPVKGVSGTIKFNDLINLTTEPGQFVKVASINPGIEVNDGIIQFTLQDGQILGVTDGTWPFMGGTLKLMPVKLNFGIAETRSYVLEVTGLDSAAFVESLELGNLSASGVFDGKLPIIFNENGEGRIEGGELRSREPGGNVSYVGELTYEDLSPMANYAFAILRSLNYSNMSIKMDGPLTGDILTKVRFDGVKQGAGTKQNFFTRQIADLPIRLNVNIQAPFYGLMATMKSMSDPATVRDPRDLGLLVDDGRRFVPKGQSAQPSSQKPGSPPDAGQPPKPVIKPDEISIQTSDSEEQL